MVGRDDPLSPGAGLHDVPHELRHHLKLARQRAGFPPDHANPTLGRRMREALQGHTGGSGFHRDCHFRHERDTDSRADHLHEGGERRALDEIARRGHGRGTEGQRLLPEAMPLFQQQQAHRAQALSTGHGMICLLRRAHEHEFLLDQRQGFEAGFCERQREDCRIEPPLLQILEKLLRDGLARGRNSMPG